MAVEHKQLIVRAEVEWFYDENEQDVLKQWFKNLVTAMGMNIMLGPESVYLDRPGLKGWSGFCLIETSHIALHSWDEGKPVLVQLDVYTCGEMQPNIIRDYLGVFNPKKIDFILLDREYKIDVLQLQSALAA